MADHREGGGQDRGTTGTGLGGFSTETKDPMEGAGGLGTGDTAAGAGGLGIDIGMGMVTDTAAPGTYYAVYEERTITAPLTVDDLQGQGQGQMRRGETGDEGANQPLGR